MYDEKLMPEVTATLLVATRYFLGVARNVAPQSFRDVLAKSDDAGVTVIWRGSEPCVLITASLDGAPHTLEVPVVIEPIRRDHH